MSLDVWLIYIVAAIGLSLTPGPNGLLSLTHGANFGFRQTLFTVLGGALGFLLLITISLAGFGALLAASERAFIVVKWVGGVYLIYLGIRLWRAPPPAISGSEATIVTPNRGKLRLFRHGFTVAISNPKGLLFFAAFLPQFMVPEASLLQQVFVFGGTFVFIEVVYELLLAALAL